MLRFITNIVLILLIKGSLFASKQPNVLVILTDDQGWGDLSLHGNKNLSTPNLDRLALEGAQFEQFYVCPVCSPTRAEFLTGRYHPRGGVYSTSTGGERLDLDEITIADWFKRAGYATGAFGKWHNGMQYPYHPNGRGFTEYYGFCSGHWAHYFSPMLERNGEIVKGNGFVIDDFTEHAMAFIEKNTKSRKPFFAYLPYNTPHSPMQVPDRYWDRFKDKKILQRSRERSREDIQHTRAALAMCENIDWNVGRLLGKLQGLGIEKETIVVFFHDNGPNGWRWNNGMRGKKGSTDEGGVRSPLFLRWPGKIKEGITINPVAAAIDLMPTLADLAGVPFPGARSLDGKSLKPLLLGNTNDWKERTIFSYWKGKVSARTDQYRFDFQGRLYDMKSDPGQSKNLTAEKPEVAKRIRDQVKIFSKEVVSKLNTEKRPFLVGDPDFKNTQLPARDAIAYGGIRRSGRAPNCSHFTNWCHLEDSITWGVDVVESGDFEVMLYYTCPAEDVGSVLRLSFQGDVLEAKVSVAFDSNYIGKRADRVMRRGEGDEKEWKSMSMGIISLKEGKGILKLGAIQIPGNFVMDFRLMMLRRKHS